MVASVKISKIERIRHIYDLSKTGKSISITLVFMVVVKISCGKCYDAIVFFIKESIVLIIRK